MKNYNAVFCSSKCIIYRLNILKIDFKWERVNKYKESKFLYVDTNDTCNLRLYFSKWIGNCLFNSKIPKKKKKGTQNKEFKMVKVKNNNRSFQLLQMRLSPLFQNIVSIVYVEWEEKSKFFKVTAIKCYSKKFKTKVFIRHTR